MELDTFWNVKLTFNNLTPAKQKLLDAEMNYFTWKIKDAIATDVEKIKDDRGLLGKMLSMLGGRVALNNVLDTLNTLTDIDFVLMKYEILSNGKRVDLIIHWNDFWFNFWHTMKNKVPLFGLGVGELATKEGLLKSFRKDMEKTYGKFKSEEIY
jgi:hypothetical protein